MLVASFQQHPVAVAADVGDRSAELREERLNAVERGPVATDHDGEVALLGLRNAAGDGASSIHAPSRRTRSVRDFVRPVVAAT